MSDGVPNGHAGSSAGAPERIGISAIIVLAAGAGTRMKSAMPKVLHPLAGRPMLWHAINAASSLGPDQLIAVVGHGREQIGAYLLRTHPTVRQAVQVDQLGTGHAVSAALEAVGQVSGTVLVTYGDVPLLTAETLTTLARAHQQDENAMTVLTSTVADPTGYGRIVRGADGELAAIVEQRDTSPDQRLICEINTGVYAFDGDALAAALSRLTTENASGELYLTDVAALTKEAGQRVGTVQARDAGETEGINDRVQLADLSRRLNAQLIRQAQLAGVTVLDPATTWLHADVSIGQDTVIAPGTSVEAGTVIGRDCVIGPDTTLSECSVGDGASVIRSHCTGATIGPAASVGPYSFLRRGATLGQSAKVGAFVEIKKSTIETNAKVPHLSYIGDATVGAGSNIGAGAITANFDGSVKHPTTVGPGVFVGTNSTLVAPVSVGSGAYVAAGSTITGDVAPGDLGIARSRQSSVTGWAVRRRGHRVPPHHNTQSRGEPADQPASDAGTAPPTAEHAVEEGAQLAGQQGTEPK